MKYFVGPALALSVALAARAQNWDLQGTTEILTGQPFVSAGTSVLAIAGGNLWYVDATATSGSGSPDLLGTVTTAYQFPVVWHDDETYVLFSGGSGSPTGSQIKITISVDAVAYDVTSFNYSGYCVGLLRTYEWTSGTQSGELTIFDPGEFVADKNEAKAAIKSLATGDAPAPPSGTGGDPNCVANCKRDYERAKANALDAWKTHTKVYCGVVGVPSTFASGCAVGVAICGWLFPPASTAACCIAGGIIGTGAGVGGCAYAFHEEYQLELRNAEREYIDCMEGCGVIIVPI